MAKTPGKTREELIAEANAKVPAPPEVPEDLSEPADPPLSPELQTEADKILADESDANTDNDEVNPHQAKVDAAEEAVGKLQKILAAYSPSAPAEHICFGNGGGRFTLGEFRSLMAMFPPT